MRLFNARATRIHVHSDKKLERGLALKNAWSNVKGDIYLYSGNLQKAEEEYQKLLEAREPAGRSWGLNRMVNLSVLKGKFIEVEDFSKQGIELTQKVGQSRWETSWRLGGASFYLRSGNLEQAIKECEEAWRSAEKARSLNGKMRAFSTGPLSSVGRRRTAFIKGV